MKKAMMQGIEEMLTKAFEFSFHIANNEIKMVSFPFLKIALINMIHQETLDIILIKSFDRPSYSNAFIDDLTNKICQPPAFLLQKADPRNRAGALGSKP